MIAYSQVLHFLTYLMHYVLARTIYTSFFGNVPILVLILLPVVVLVALRGGGGAWRRRRPSSRKVYRDELARQRARKDAAAEAGRRGRLG